MMIQALLVIMMIGWLNGCVHDRLGSSDQQDAAEAIKDRSPSEQEALRERKVSEKEVRRTRRLVLLC